MGQTGMACLDLSDDKHVRSWQLSKLNSLGCHIQADQMANTLGVRPSSSGSTRLQPPWVPISILVLREDVKMASLRRLFPRGHTHSTRKQGPDQVSRRGGKLDQRESCIHGLAVWSGDFGLEQAWAMQNFADRNITAKEGWKRIGYFGDM